MARFQSIKPSCELLTFNFVFPTRFSLFGCKAVSFPSVFFHFERRHCHCQGKTLLVAFVSMSGENAYFIFFSLTLSSCLLPDFQFLHPAYTYSSDSCPQAGAFSANSTFWDGFNPQTGSSIDSSSLCKIPPTTFSREKHSPVLLCLLEQFLCSVFDSNCFWLFNIHSISLCTFYTTLCLFSLQLMVFSALFVYI